MKEEETDSSPDSMHPRYPPPSSLIGISPAGGSPNTNLTSLCSLSLGEG